MNAIVLHSQETPANKWVYPIPTEELANELKSQAVLTEHPFVVEAIEENKQRHSVEVWPGFGKLTGDYNRGDSLAEEYNNIRRL